jgi:manganese/zinc/iron transport system substrate-binding protein
MSKNLRSCHLGPATAGRVRVLALASSLALACLTACERGTSEAAPAGLPRVLTTTGMIGDMAARIAGAYATVESLMGPGVDPHLYKPSEGDVRRLAEADLILYNGLNLEGKMGDLFAKLGASRPVVAIAEGLPRERLRKPPEFLGHFDPHVWFDVDLWSRTLEPIAGALARLDPAHAAAFQENAARLRAELEALDVEVREKISTIPAAQRVLVTAHDAFGYFGLRYGMEVVGLQGISTAAEAGIGDVERVVRIILERRVKAIFVESSVPRRTIEAVREACGEKGHDVAIGGQLFSDAMGTAGTPEGTYPGMVRYNVKAIVEALR